jgi:hypothetical protein
MNITHDKNAKNGEMVVLAKAGLMMTDVNLTQPGAGRLALVTNWNYNYVIRNPRMMRKPTI